MYTSGFHLINGGRSSLWLMGLVNMFGVCQAAAAPSIPHVTAHVVNLTVEAVSSALTGSLNVPTGSAELHKLHKKTNFSKIGNHHGSK